MLNFIGKEDKPIGKLRKHKPYLSFIKNKNVSNGHSIVEINVLFH